MPRFMWVFVFLVFLSSIETEFPFVTIQASTIESRGEGPNDKPGAPILTSTTHGFQRIEGGPIGHLLTSPSGRKTFTVEEISPRYEIIRDDFLVNDDSTGGCLQINSRVAVDMTGDFVICWEDSRNGGRDWDIYAQRYSNSGELLGQNFRVNDDVVSSRQEHPSMAMDAGGNFVICWEDDRNGNWDIYAQRFTSAGVPLGANFRVNDDEDIGPQWFPSIDMDDGGSFAVCWEDERNHGSDIYVQRYNRLGDPVGLNFRVTGDCQTDRQWLPSIAMGRDEEFIICWENYRYGNRDIYAQRFDSSGDTLGANFRANDDAGLSGQYWPAVSLDVDGDFVICWQDWRSSESDIYAQRYSAFGEPCGLNFRVNDDAGSYNQWAPSVSKRSEGGFVICWEDDRDGDSNIYAQRYDESGGALNDNMRVNGGWGLGNQYRPSIAVDGDGNFVICWETYRNGNSDIHAQQFVASGDSLRTHFRVNDDVGSSCQTQPFLAKGSDGKFIVCWADARNGNSDLYAQRYDESGEPLGSNFKVNNDAGTRDQYAPSAGIGSAGQVVICWEDEYNYNTDIYAQRFNRLGEGLGSNFRVNDDEGMRNQHAPSLGMGADGEFVICWADERNDASDIYAQRYDRFGAMLDSNFRVNDDAGPGNQTRPSLEVDADGNFVICWEDQRNGDPDIYAQRYERSGVALDSNFRVNDNDGSSIQIRPYVGVDALGNFVICWEDQRNGDPDIYAQAYNSSGETVGSNFRVNDQEGAGAQTGPSLAMGEDSNFVICWEDQRNGDSDVYVQRFLAPDIPWGVNYLVNRRPDVTNLNQSYPTIGLNGDCISFAWEDARRSKGSDIYAKVVTRSWERADETWYTIKPRRFILHQNYPNPFNESTRICYELVAPDLPSSTVSLNVFNILGQLVKTLVEKEQAAGIHRVVWDGRDARGRDLSSGIYICRLQIGELVQTMRMILLK